MSTHPNVILMAVLKPDDLARKTMRSILSEYAHEEEKVVIGDNEYTSLIMENGYDDGWQIAADEGDLVFFDYVTYGYGETIAWDDLEQQKKELERWAQEASKKHHCIYSIQITANYW